MRIGIQRQRAYRCNCHGRSAGHPVVEVNEIVGEMAELLRREAARYDVAIRTDFAADAPKAMVDRVQLMQVFMNLMLNGIGAMKDTGGVPTVPTQVGEDGRLLVSVRDTGVGLPGEKADQIFDPFFTTEAQGSGMGLSISRSIVQTHGSYLWATANGGQGAAFHFALPPAEIADTLPNGNSGLVGTPDWITL